MATKHSKNHTKHDQTNATVPTTASTTTGASPPEPKKLELGNKFNLFSIFPTFLIIIVPLSLTMAIIQVFGSSKDYQNRQAQAGSIFVFPSLTLIHLATTGSTILMSLAAWLVWAEGGFHVDSEALPLYISQVSLSIIWHPLVLRIGLACLGYVYSLVNFGTLYGCYWVFGKVSPLSKLFVMPCLVWVGYLTFLTSMLM